MAHVEKKATCICGERYCMTCEERCPKCYGIHIRRSI